MSSAICQNFVQNAWKKELCSNCFKSKDEHIAKPKPKPIQLVASYEVTGILKKEKKTKSHNTVGFLNDLTEVIGYGGDDWISDNEDDVDNESSSDGDGSVESDDEESSKELDKITKENTDYNTTSLGEVEVKKTYTQLLLGKPLVDATGKKQTLLVSVTPFGEDISNPPRKYTVKSFSHVPIVKTNKDVIPENKTNNVVLTSYTKNDDESKNEEKSLLDEISETLESGKNPIQIMSKKKMQQQIHLSVIENNKENIAQEADTCALTKSEITEIKPQNKTMISERKINLTRTPALKRDIEKPKIYQTSTAKIELLNNKNSKFNKEIINSDSTDIKSNEVNNNNLIEEGEKKDKESFNARNCTNLIKAEITHSNIDRMEIKEKSPLLMPRKIEDKVNGIPPPIPAKNPALYSREQAGKPDGKEDPLPLELPPLPVTPPPVLESQASFLHGVPPPIYEKPKLPTKPATVLIRKSVNPNSQVVQPQPLSTFSIDSSDKVPLCKQDSNDADPRTGKRRAPLPPEESNGLIYARSSLENSHVEHETVKEKDKRERASSCAPKLTEENDYIPPEPTPRKSLSVSTDCLVTEEKKKQKGRFSLKKFLRMGSSKDLTKISVELATPKLDEIPDCSPQAKPRLVIVHPCELNGAQVEVVAKPLVDQVDSQVNSQDYSSSNGDYEDFNNIKMSKPPPPPRNYFETNHSKPNLPHPPKSLEILNKQRQISRKNSASKKAETVYANIGEVRSAIVPNKPVRTASMREREALQQKHLRKNHIHNYESVNIRGKDESGHENVYDYINSTRSSSPDSDSSRGKGSPKCKVVRLGKRSESSIDVSGEYFKYGNIPRSISLTYCGSETESEIYSPYGFYGSESEVTEDDHDWIQNGRTHKLRSRKGRSIVHKNLEDNYGAVVVANHEALAQVLENIQQINHIQPALRGLKTAPNLRWSDFQLKTGVSPPIRVGRHAFHQALWGAQHVTLGVIAGVPASGAISGLGNLNLQAVTEFSDLVNSNFLSHKESAEEQGEVSKQIQATVSVLPWLQIHTIQSYSELIKPKIQNAEEAWKDANFVMLQLVNALKTLQAQGIEEIPLSLNCFILCKEMDKDNHHRLCILQGLASDLANKASEEKFGTLCMCALKALSVLQTSPKITPLIQSLLSHERAVSLTQVKSVLEFSLWGPSDVSLGSTIKERELALQRWLDLQRATVLHGLVCARVQLTVYEECHLLFLVRSNTRMMCDASLLIESSNMKHSVTSIHK